MCEAFGYQWRLKGGVYQIRSVTWYRDREEEPPGTLVKAVAIAREQKLPLTLEWLAASAALPPTRQQKLWVHAPATQSVLMRFRPALQFYAALSPEQRIALESKEGLPGEALSAPQREALTSAIQSIARDWPPSAAAAARVTLARETGVARFTFAAEGRSVDATIPLPSAAATRPAGPGFSPPGLPAPGFRPAPSQP